MPHIYPTLNPSLSLMVSFSLSIMHACLHVCMLCMYVWKHKYIWTQILEFDYNVCLCIFLGLTTVHWAINKWAHFWETQTLFFPAITGCFERHFLTIFMPHFWKPSRVHHIMPTLSELWNFVFVFVGEGGYLKIPSLVLWLLESFCLSVFLPSLL